MSFNIIKIFKNEVTGKKSSVFLLDGLSSILEIKSKEEKLLKSLNNVI